MRISDWSSDVCSSDLPSATAPGPVHTAISPPALMAKFRSEVDSLPLSWSTRGRRDTFASYHCCTLIHKRAQYLAFLSSALLALINRPPLRLTLAGEASDDPRNTMPIIKIGRASCRERVCQSV